MSPSPTPPSGPEGPALGLRERKKAKTKAEIQRQALRLFSEQGYAETSVEQIAAAAEVSPSTFFRYYPTKDDVVLADFMDARTMQLMIDAPADLRPLAALRHAVVQSMTSLSAEDLALESLRNQLIRTVPELRRGLIAEMTRPIGLLAHALEQRLGREPGDPDVRMYAAAAVGALLTVAEPGEEVAHAIPDVEAMMQRLDAAITRLERMLVLPEAERSTQ
ncbi:MAG: TetR family transcriptional regulator [Nocardioides sp.]|nr:TetR family transcriptional regulator [Nocardioides sp.]